MARVLLVYANPAITAAPVPPYGMERIAQVFGLAGCEVRMLAPFIEPDPVAIVREQLDAWQPDLVGFSVRNIDDTLIVRGVDGEGELDTHFYLDAVKALVDVAVEALGAERVMAGGAAVGAGPEPVLRHLGLAWGITGPAEDLCWSIGRRLASGEGLVLPKDARVVRVASPAPRPRGFADAWRPPPGPTPRLAPYLRLTVARNSRVPVQIAHGCDRRCAFCVEARTTGYRVVQRNPDDIVAEVRALRRAGVRRFWLTTSELNVPDERHALEVLRRLKHQPADYRLYLQPAPISDALLDALEDLGVDPGGLNFEFGHLSDTILRAGGGPANWRHIEALADTFLRRGYRQLGGSMLFGAHWLETDATVAEAITRIRQLDASFEDGLGLAYACGGRLYPETTLAKWVADHREESAPHLYGDDDPSFVRPVVFCRPGSPRGLLRHVVDALGQTRGPIAPMNTETPASPDQLEAERLVNRGIWRLGEDRAPEAAACLEGALERVPDHLEALRQLALVYANHLGDGARAVEALERLGAALPAGDARYSEVEAALVALRGPGA